MTCNTGDHRIRLLLQFFQGNSTRKFSLYRERHNGFPLSAFFQIRQVPLSAPFRPLASWGFDSTDECFKHDHSAGNGFLYTGISSSARCSDLILYPVKSVDKDDQYRFDYNDVGFGNTHSQGATVIITCTERGQPAIVEGYDQQRISITSSQNLLAACANVGGSQYTWTTFGRILQFDEIIMEQPIE
ncbi:unnamed protein product [Thelazia callipaeda]|uniref:Sushi domain-containing protein n=1 Tax=Thelazia callipaeda TaxID=103827 RepID=A0A0N5D842_THECL|nr:unnamed protein product [Thelazia callipaeda]